MADEMSLHHVPGLRCPHCDGRIDGAAVTFGGQPEGGDVGVCFHCYGLLEYDGKGSAAKIDLDDPKIDDLTRAEIANVVLAMKGYKKLRAFRNN